jgi:hypothetical protein
MGKRSNNPARSNCEVDSTVRGSSSTLCCWSRISPPRRPIRVFPFMSPLVSCRLSLPFFDPLISLFYSS